MQVQKTVTEYRKETYRGWRMKEIKCQKYSLMWFTKRNKRRYMIIIALIIIIFLALPIIFGIITHNLELFSIYAVSPIVLLFCYTIWNEYKTKDHKREYKHWNYTMVHKQRKQDDKKNKKWLI